MKLFGQLVRTVVNVALLPVTIPVAIAADFATCGGEMNDHGQSYTLETLRKLKREASEDFDE